MHVHAGARVDDIIDRSHGRDIVHVHRQCTTERRDGVSSSCRGRGVDGDHKSDIPATIFGLVDRDVSRCMSRHEAVGRIVGCTDEQVVVAE